MKQILLITIVFLYAVNFFAQNTDTTLTYYDSEWLEIENPEAAMYYGKLYMNESQIWISEDYFKNGQVQMKGSYKSNLKRVRHGAFEYYYENGHMKSKGEIREGKKEGLWSEWYEEGELMEEIDYSEGVFNGELYTYWKNGRTKRRDIYSKGDFRKGEVWDSLGVKLDHFPYFENAEFNGGEGAMFQYVAKNTKYPLLAQEMGVEGIVIVQFTILKDGNVTNVFAKKGVHKILDKEAVRVISSMPKWKPGLKEGNPVKVAFNLPVSFKLVN